jgi:alkanesulfonate monooxygenase SsuD/methylene tetrahydromethanopterin reductase-like flavin-dependent oxidoreductase (luciferase family)
MAQRSIRDIDIALGGTDHSRSDLVLIARVADELGVGNVYVTEGTGRDAFSVLNEMALKTQRIGLGTGIVNVFSRTPSALAQSTASVLELMGDRTFNLGLGTSGKLLMQKYHGVPFDRPVSRMRETVQIIDTAFATGKLPEGGDIFPLAGLPLGITAPRAQLRIYVAGLGGATLDVVGRNADGWLPIWPSIRHGGELRAVIEEAAADAGRPRPQVSAYLYGGVGDDEALRSHVRATMAWYIAANGTAYRRLFESYGYHDEAERICSLWAAGDREAARRSVPDHLIADTALVGEPAEFFAAVDRHIQAGVDRPVLRLLGQLRAAQCIEMLARLADHGTGAAA